MMRMRSGMNYEQGDILLVPFPFTDLSSTKKRPVLVMSKTEDNQISEDLVTCAMTSKQRNFTYSLEIDNKDLEKGSLPIRSTILISKLFTIEKGLVLKKIAQLDGKTMKQVRIKFCKMI